MNAIQTIQLKQIGEVVYNLNALAQSKKLTGLTMLALSRSFTKKSCIIGNF